MTRDKNICNDDVVGVVKLILIPVTTMAKNQAKTKLSSNSRHSQHGTQMS